VKSATQSRFGAAGCLEDLIRAAQLGDLTLEPLDLGMLLAALPRPLPVVDLGSAHPLARPVGGSVTY
jgi:hypothetical protein